MARRADFTPPDSAAPAAGPPFAAAFAAVPERAARSPLFGMSPLSSVQFCPGR
ncbi:hypothetical protein SLNWT_3891 [Streptomyces albus]|uniref:Uncharacterized protein n=1 Tax=Streptomyces albus (strain ATCC 21838 / DSM 41398 / FERM P-419 / JCM 4703 / NBRC 107858) TaxID=1081613 RepID=A0A0B5F1R2_STRA4|nr:hypothetical protein SLNWT_3891 [Streptomyces albus]AOU78574.1 hypothetical protein SLNHY_3883 [Streptomyces albus]AYN34316.1 hypothetical protein DUI70_3816 [Streptomyces albus]